MGLRWTAGAAELPGAVRYTLVAGDGPTDRWHVSVAMPPPGLAATVAGPGPFPALYLVDGFMTFAIAAQIAKNTLAFSLGQLRPVVIVGVSPATDDFAQLRAQRARDLTPTDAEPRYSQGRIRTGRAVPPRCSI